MDAHEIIRTISEAKKQTPVKVTIQGTLSAVTFPETVKIFRDKANQLAIVFGDWEEIEPVLTEHAADIVDRVVEESARYSAIPLVDKKKFNARIEPGAIIRDQVEIHDHAVIMMGAIINIGAVIGEETMIDMGAILGGRAIVGKHCHIGAGAVLAGVIEPPSATPVVIEDDVLIGANAVVIEGVRVGKGAVVAAGAVVIDDVEPHTVVAGVPARKIKDIDEKTKDKTNFMDELRNL